MWVNAGLIPQARQGGRGIWAFAVAGSKFEGTGFEKLQMVQTQVAVLALGASAGGARNGLCGCCDGEAASLLEGVVPRAGEFDRREARFVGFGINVTFGEDFKNPA